MAVVLLCCGLFGAACAEGLTLEPAPSQTQDGEAAEAASEQNEAAPEQNGDVEDTPQEEGKAGEADPQTTETEETALQETTEVEAPQDVAEAETGKPVLYIVLVDCGDTLFGGKHFNSSAVTKTIDPDGTVLSLIAAAPPLLCPEANVSVWGYHSDVIENDSKIVAMSDAAAVNGQVHKLYDTALGQRQSSDLVNALDVILKKLQEVALAEKYDCRLVILTGGALNYVTPKDKPGTSNLKAEVDALRDAGCRITAFGFDLQNSSLLTENAKADWLISAEQFGEGEYTAIPYGSDETEPLKAYAAAVLDYFAAQGGYQPSEPAPQSFDEDDVLVYMVKNVVKVKESIKDTIEKEEERDCYKASRAGESRGLALQTPPDASAPVWRCAKEAPAEADSAAEAPPVVEETPSVLESVQAQLDADGDGVLDTATLYVGYNQLMPLGDLNPSQFSVSGKYGDLLEAQVQDGNLMLTPHAVGDQDKPTVVFTDPNDPEQKLELTVPVKTYTLDWKYNADAQFSYGGEPVSLLFAAEGELAFTLEKKDDAADGGWREVSPDAVTREAGEAGTELKAGALAPGSYRLTAWIQAGENQLAKEMRSFSVTLTFDDVPEAVELQTPYFREQPGQRVPLTVNGQPVDLSAYRCAVDPAELADVYLDGGEGCLYIVPKAAGSGLIKLTDEAGQEELVTLSLRVNRVTAKPVFWLLAVAAPLCLIGLTAVITLLIAKNKRR